MNFKYPELELKEEDKMSNKDIVGEGIVLSAAFSLIVGGFMAVYNSVILPRDFKKKFGPDYWSQKTKEVMEKGPVDEIRQDINGSFVMILPSSYQNPEY